MVEGLVTEKLLEYPNIAELEKCNAFAFRNDIKGIWQHMCAQRLPSQIYLAFARRRVSEEEGWCRRGGTHS